MIFSFRVVLSLQDKAPLEAVTPAGLTHRTATARSCPEASRDRAERNNMPCAAAVPNGGGMPVAAWQYDCATSSIRVIKRCVRLGQAGYPGKEHFSTGPVVGFVVSDLRAAVDELRRAGIAC